MYWMKSRNMKKIIWGIFAVLLCSIVTYGLMLITLSVFLGPASGVASIMRRIGCSEVLIFHGRIFTIELGWVLSSFIGGLLVGLWCKYHGWFHGLVVVLCSYIIHGLAIMQTEVVQEALKGMFVEKGLYTGRIFVSIIIFLLCLLCGGIGGELGVRIRTKLLKRAN